MEFITFEKLATLCMHLALLTILIKTQRVETSTIKQDTGRDTLTTILSLSSSATTPIPPAITTAAKTVTVAAAATTTTTVATTTAEATTTTTTTPASTPALSHVNSTVTDGASSIYLTSQPPTVKTLGPSLRPTVRNQTVHWNHSTKSQHKTTSNFYSTTPFPSKFSTTNAVLNETPQPRSITTVVSYTTKLKYPITSSTSRVISKITRGHSSLQLLNDTKTSLEKSSTSVLPSLLTSTSTSTLVSTSAASLHSSSVSLGTTTSKKPEIQSTFLATVLSTSPANTTKTAVTTTAGNIFTKQTSLDINATGATSKESQKLTTEEQVATGICVPLFVLSILGLIYFFYKRKRQDQSIKFPETCNESSWSYANCAFAGESGENKAAESN